MGRDAPMSSIRPGRKRWVYLSGDCFLAAVLGLATAAAATAGTDWDATWHGGFDNGGDGVQVIVTGGQVLGFYFHGDYIDSDTGTPAAGGAIAFHWDGGEGKLSEVGGQHQLAIHETGQPDRVILLTRDE